MRKSLKTIILVGTFLTAFVVGDNGYGIKALEQSSLHIETSEPVEEQNILYQKQVSYQPNQDLSTILNTPSPTPETIATPVRAEISTPSPDEALKVADTEAGQTMEVKDEKTNKKEEGPVVFLGDSITEGLSVYGYFPEAKIIGVNSLNTISAKEQIENVVSLKPSKLFILIGINDIWEGGSVDEYIDRYRELINKIKAGTSDSKIYIESILPVSEYAMERNEQISNKIIDEANNKIKVMAREVGVNYIDINSAFKDNKGNLRSEYTNDGVHLIDYYYPTWTGILERYMK